MARLTPDEAVEAVKAYLEQQREGFGHLFDDRGPDWSRYDGSIHWGELREEFERRAVSDA